MLSALSRYFSFIPHNSKRGILVLPYFTDEGLSCGKIKKPDQSHKALSEFNLTQILLFFRSGTYISQTFYCNYHCFHLQIWCKIRALSFKMSLFKSDYESFVFFIQPAETTIMHLLRLSTFKKFNEKLVSFTKISF